MNIARDDDLVLIQLTVSNTRRAIRRWRSTPASSNCSANIRASSRQRDDQPHSGRRRKTGRSATASRNTYRTKPAALRAGSSHRTASLQAAVRIVPVRLEEGGGLRRLQEIEQRLGRIGMSPCRCPTALSEARDQYLRLPGEWPDDLDAGDNHFRSSLLRRCRPRGSPASRPHATRRMFGFGLELIGKAEAAPPLCADASSRPRRGRIRVGRLLLPEQRSLEASGVEMSGFGAPLRRPRRRAANWQSCAQCRRRPCRLSGRCRDPGG